MVSRLARVVIDDIPRPVDLLQLQQHEFDAAFAQRGLDAYNVTIHPERVTLVDDPVLGPDRVVARLSVLDTDTGPTENPRAQLEPRSTLREGTEAWFGWALYLPGDWQVLPPLGWVTFASIYGPPSNGSGPLRIGIEGSGDVIAWHRDIATSFDSPWSMPVVRGQWMDFAMHVKMSASATIGFVELWLNLSAGWEIQTLTGGVTRLPMATLGPANGGGANAARISAYRKVGMFPEMTCYFGGHRIGSSLAAVDPRSYG